MATLSRGNDLLPFSPQFMFDFAGNVLLRTTNRLAPINLGYDNNGNEATIGPFSVTYDVENRQTGLTSISNGTATYTYDGDGRRVTKTTGGVTTTYVYDAKGDLAAEYSTQPPPPPCLTCYVTTDHLGSTRVVTDENASVIARHDFLPFGEELTTSNRTAALGYGAYDNVMHKYTGQERDVEGPGLDFFHARYFHGAQGRFTIPDWSEKPLAIQYANLTNPQTLNLYAYVRNNPLRLFDLDGHYEVNDSGCADDAKCQKKYDKAAGRFEKAVEQDLKSKDDNVRAAAEAFGAEGEANGIHVSFADLLRQGEKGAVDPFGSTGNDINIQVSIDWSLSGGSLRETVAHEGTHVGADLKFLNSFDPTTGYDQSLNPTHGQTEFDAYRAGAGVTREHGFGPNDAQKIWNFLKNSPTYGPILNVPVFPTSQFGGGEYAQH